MIGYVFLFVLGGFVFWALGGRNSRANKQQSEFKPNEEIVNIQEKVIEKEKLSLDEKDVQRKAIDSIIQKQKHILNGKIVASSSSNLNPDKYDGAFD